ncbi:MAG: hypothetical protein OHK0012_08530 [Synechococcales cyanobacterium]
MNPTEPSTPASNFFENRLYETNQPIPEQCRIRVRTLDGTDIKGLLLLDTENFVRRVSDLLNDARNFIPLTNAELYRNGRRLSTHNFMCISKQAIAFVTEDH